MDCRYIVGLEYETEYSCEESGCNSEGICRCGKISNPHVTSVQSWEIAKHYGDYNAPLQYHAIERYCSRLETEDFEIEWSSSYYGDEIDRVELTDTTKKAIVDIKNLQDNDLIEYFLRHEYGEVLQQYRDRVWQFKQKVEMSRIILGNQTRRDIKQTCVEFYKRAIASDYEPILLCELYEEVYRVIDGYHRFTALKERGDKFTHVIYFERTLPASAAFQLSGAL